MPIALADLARHRMRLCYPELQRASGPTPACAGSAWRTRGLDEIRGQVARLVVAARGRQPGRRLPPGPPVLVASVSLSCSTAGSAQPRRLNFLLRLPQSPGQISGAPRSELPSQNASQDDIGVLLNAFLNANMVQFTPRFSPPHSKT